MVRISDVVSQNPWWKHGSNFVQYDKNFKEAKAKPVFFQRKEIELNKGKICVLRGPRQVGKTTYVKDLVSQLIVKGVNPDNILYLSSDFFVSRRELRNAIAYFMDKNIDADDLYVFIDEITSIKDWNLELKYLSDSGVAKKSRIVATGSSASSLRKKGELLPGRGLEGNEYHLRPLSFREFVLQTAREIIQTIRDPETRDSIRKLQTILGTTGISVGFSSDQLFKALSSVAPFKRELEYLFSLYLRFGGYPFVVNDYLIRKLRNEGTQSGFSIDPKLSETLVRDIIGDITKLGKQETFIKQILREVFEKYGSRYSFSKLAHDVGTTHVTAIDYLDTLEESFILSVIYAFDFEKKDIKFKGDKKVFFQDPFIIHSIRSYLTGMDVNEIIEETMQDEELIGKIVEGIVMSHLIMNQEVPIMRETQTFLWCYYDTRGKEIDNILRIAETCFALEVKYQSTITSKDIWMIPQVKEYTILTKEDLKIDGGVLLAPVDMLLALVEKSNRTL